MPIYTRWSNETCERVSIILATLVKASGEERLHECNRPELSCVEWVDDQLLIDGQIVAHYLDLIDLRRPDGSRVNLSHDDGPPPDAETLARLQRIVLTDMPPVAVDPRDWPVVAEAMGREGDDKHMIRVRQHRDGRSIVYAVAMSDFNLSGGDSRGGQICHSGDDVAAAVKTVGLEAGIPSALINRCVARLPARVLR